MGDCVVISEVAVRLVGESVLAALARRRFAPQFVRVVKKFEGSKHTTQTHHSPLFTTFLLLVYS